MQMDAVEIKKKITNATRNVESRISARRALWDAEMEESASHHVAEIEK